MHVPTSLPHLASLRSQVPWAGSSALAPNLLRPVAAPTSSCHTDG